MLSIPARPSLSRSPLVTPRLVLRPLEQVDEPDLWDAISANREQLQRWLPWVPYNDSHEANQRYIEACLTDWDIGRALRFSIRLAETERLVGLVSLDNCVHIHRNCELGYWLCSDVWGQGYMTEASLACLRFAFTRLGAHRVRCAAATENHRSLAVIARLGFRFEGIAREAEYVDSRWVDHAIFARLSSDR